MRNAGGNVLILNTIRLWVVFCPVTNLRTSLSVCTNLQVFARIPLPTPFGGHPPPGGGHWGSAYTATPGGVALRVVLRKTIHRVLKLCGQIPRKSHRNALPAANFPGKTQKTPQTLKSLWRDFYFSALIHPFAGAVLHFGQHGGQTAALLLA